MYFLFRGRRGRLVQGQFFFCFSEQVFHERETTEEGREKNRRRTKKKKKKRGESGWNSQVVHGASLIEGREARAGQETRNYANRIHELFRSRWVRLEFLLVLSLGEEKNGRGMMNQQFNKRK